MTTKPIIKPLGDEVYLCFDSTHDLKEAKRRFLTRFGYRPDEVRHDYGLLWLGPVEEKSLMPGLA